MVEDEVIASHLSTLLTPAITSQENYYRQLGFRDRILNLPLMLAAVLTLLWRDIAGVTELTRMLAVNFITRLNKGAAIHELVTNVCRLPSALFSE
jgi:hypothetical protein